MVTAARTAPSEALRYEVVGNDHLNINTRTLVAVPTPDAYRVWSSAISGQDIVLIAATEEIAVYKARISSKNLLDCSDDPLAGRQRLVVEFSDLKRIERFHLSEIATLDRVDANAAVRSLVRPQVGKDLTLTDLKGVFPYQVDEVSQVDLEQTAEDKAVLHGLARAHPFGDAHGSIRLVLRRRGRVVAGCILRSGLEGEKSHNAESTVFGRSAHALRGNSLFISRLLSRSDPIARQHEFLALLRAVSYLAVSAYSEPTSYISGVSYDFIPAAIRAGFSVSIPHRAYGSLYYWKVVFAQPVISIPDASQSRKEFRQLKRRRSENSWLVNAREDRLPVAEKNLRWALADRPEQRGIWRSICSGDILFFCENGKFVIAHGSVASTDRHTIPNFEQFPLGIRLETFERLERPIALGALRSPGALFRESAQAIAPIQRDLHFSLMQKLENDGGTGRMWVEPNPFLLHRTNFETAPRSLFVVQAWELRDSILPIIAETCATIGWSAIHARDREGQVIFDDIWAMLNECQAVLVDFTHRRPNVYLEYGMALVLGKPIIAITQDQADLPSDTPNLKYRKYRGDVNAFADLHAKLPQAILDTVSDLESMRTKVRR